MSLQHPGSTRPASRNRSNWDTGSGGRWLFGSQGNRTRPQAHRGHSDPQTPGKSTRIYMGFPDMSSRQNCNTFGHASPTHQRLLNVVRPELARRQEAEQRRAQEVLPSNSAVTAASKMLRLKGSGRVPPTQGRQEGRAGASVSRNHSPETRRTGPTPAAVEAGGDFQHYGEVRPEAGFGEHSCKHRVKASGGARFRVPVSTGSSVLPGRD